MMPFLIVFIGSGTGGMIRYGVGVVAVRLLGMEFPFGTLAINVSGSLAMGLLAEFFMIRSGLSQDMRLFLTTGVMGGFTTFSTFSLDTVVLWQRGQWGSATLYVALSLGLSLAALTAGMLLIRLSSGVQAA